VIGFDRATGEALWRYQREAPEGFYVSEHAGLALSGDRLLTGFTDGVVVALDARDGSILWERDTTGDLQVSSDTIRFTDVDTTPVVIGETVYVASFAGGLYALERSSGSVRWMRDDLTGVVGIAEAPDGRLILSSGDLGIVAARARDGEPLWKTRIARGAPTAPIVEGDLILVGESEGGLLALALDDGRELGRLENGHGFAASAEVEAGLGAALSNAGGLFVFAVR
jgi:outer membrane protein assembly factor BamB